MKIDLLRSFLAQKLPHRLYGTRPGRLRGWLLKHLYRFYSKGRLPLRVYLHGRWLYLNKANPYPFVLADAPAFDSGLVAAAQCLQRHLQRPLRVVDVGCSIGDTVALLEHRIPGGVESYVCVDGAEENRPFFELNTTGVRDVSVHFAMLSAAADEVPSLIRQHPGTAHASGTERVSSQTLDDVLAGCGRRGECDLLKIDVDGYDGEVLLGAQKALGRHQPMVVFEWHPLLIERCGNDRRSAFLALIAAGYSKLLWFGNRGPFSHRCELAQVMTEIDWWNDFLLARRLPAEPHFDIVALPPRLEKLADTIPRAANYGP
jgi:FkbM family methyltransferase